MEITPVTFLCVYVFNTGLCHKHTDLYTYATNNLQSSNKAGSDACDSFWFSPPCNDNHSGLDPIWAWTYSQWHHTLSPFLFLHACLRSRGTVPVSLWLGIAHKIACAKAGRRIMIDVTHQLTPSEAPRRGNGFGLGLLLNLSLQVNQRSSFSLFLGECKSIPHGSNVSKQNIASLAFFL